MHISAGEFNLEGEMVKGMIYFSTHRKGKIIVIECYNNAIIPIEVRKTPLGNNTLWVVGHQLFERPVSDNAVISVKIAEELNAVTTVLTLRCENMVSDVRADVYGSLSVSTMEGAWTVEEGVLRSFLRKHDISYPVGVCYAISQKVCMFGLDISESSRHWLITFENGFKFPVFKTSYGCRLLDIDLCYAHPIKLLCVRVWESRRDFVDFSLICVSGNVVSLCEHIKYGDKVIEYSGRTMKTSTLTKQMMLL